MVPRITSFSDEQQWHGVFYQKVLGVDTVELIESIADEIARAEDFQVIQESQEP